MTSPECVPGISTPGRVAQLILRHPVTGVDLMVLDILPKKSLGAAGLQGITLGDDMEGLYRLPGTTPIKSHAYQEGATLGVPRVDARHPRLLLHTQASTPEELEQVETLLWTVLSKKWDCVLRVYGPDGPDGPVGPGEVSWRELTVRLFDTPSDKTNRMHGSRLFANHECVLVAVDPFWYSPSHTFTFTRADMTPVGGGFEIDVPIWNETDQLGFVEWNSGELGAAAEVWSFQDGEAVDGAGAPVMIPLPSLAGANKTFWVQTYPDRWGLWVKDQGQDWARMNSRTFAKAIAANTPDPRTIKARLVGGDADSAMMLTIPRRWDRPFGGELPIAAQMVTDQ